MVLTTSLFLSADFDQDHLTKSPQTRPPKRACAAPGSEAAQSFPPGPTLPSAPLVFVVHFLEIRIDHIGVAARAAALAGGSGAAGRAVVLVESLADLHGHLGQGVGLRADVAHIVALDRFLEVADGGLRRLLVGGCNLV